MFVRFIGLMAFLLAGLITCAQQAAIVISDYRTGEPLPFVHVCFDGTTSNYQKHQVSDLQGRVKNEAREISRIAISCVGYETLVDTVLPGESRTFRLRPAIHTMSEVVVTAQFAPERADRSIYKVHVINSRRIEQKAATNLTELLAGENNMRISQGGVLGSNLSIQGLSGENVKFLVDGIPLIGRMNGNIDLNQINLYNVDHVEVIEGPMSVVYGSNAIAGVINIITKENKSASFTSSVNSYYESIGVYNFDAGVSKRLNKHLLSLNASRNFFEAVTNDNNSRDTRWKPRRQYNADAFYLYAAGKLRLKVSGQYFNELLLDKGALLAPYYERAFDNHFTTLRATGRVESSFTPLKDRQWSMVAAFSSYNRVKNRYLKDMTTLSEMLTPNWDDQDTTEISNALFRAWFSRNRPEESVNYQAGIDLNLESGSGKRILNGTQQIGDYAAFISLKIDPTEKLSLQPGARVIYNTKYKAPLVYSMNLKWDLISDWTLRTTYARGFKSPALKELYLYFVDINHNVRGNPELKAEYSHNVNLNLNFSQESKKSFLIAEAGVFYNNVSNNITLAPEGSDLYTYINIGKYISRGGLASISWSINPWLSFKIGLSTSGQSFAFEGPVIKDAEIHWNRDLTSNLTVRLQKAGFSFAAFYKYSGSAPQVIPGGDRTIFVSWIHDYHTMDVSAIKNLFHNRLSLSTGVKNLFDVRVIPATGGGGGAHSGSSDSVNVAWGRTWFIKMSFNLNRYK